MINKTIILLILLFSGCDLPVNVENYEERYTLFANIDFFLATEFRSISTIDTVYLSQSSPIGSGIQSEDLYVSGAQIILTGPTGFDDLFFIDDSSNPGKYYPPEESIDHDLPLDFSLIQNGFILKNEHRFAPGNTYFIEAIIDVDTLIAQTTIPDSIQFLSQEGEYNCDGNLVPVPTIKTDNFNDENLINLFMESDLSGVDTIFLHTEGCYIGSFASFPYFYLEFDASASSIVRTVTLALEADKLTLESDIPNFDLSAGNTQENDLNCNGINDSVYANLFYNWPCEEAALHQNDIFKLWKGHLYDSEDRLYFQNPFIWVVETTPIPMMWLYFNYYGLQLILIQATDENYYEYLSGDPFGQNQMLQPDSNIQNGLGLFSSTLSRAFFIYTHPSNGN